MEVVPLEDFSVTILPWVIEANLIELVRYFGNASDAEFYENLGLSWLLTKIPLPFYNAVVLTNLEEKQVEKKIGRLINYYKMYNVPIIWWLGPSTLPKDLDIYLKKHGFVRGIDLAGMAMDLRRLPDKQIKDKNFSIKQVNNIDRLKEWVHLIKKGFSISDEIIGFIFEFEKQLGIGKDRPWRRYIGYIDQEPVSTSSIFLGKEAAGLYSVSTIPEFRNCGLGSAITIESLKDARSIGYKIGVLQAPSIEGKLYRRIGFQQYCTMYQYILFK